MHILNRFFSIAYSGYVKIYKIVFAKSLFILNFIRAMESKKAFFTPLDFYLLQYVIARCNKPSNIVSFLEHTTNKNSSQPLLTIVVLKESIFSLVVMLKSLSKQRVKDYQLIIVGTHPKRLLYTLLFSNADYIELSKTPNEHELISFSLAYAKGKNICFLRSSDKLSPYFYKAIKEINNEEDSLTLLHTKKDINFFPNEDVQANSLTALETLIRLCSIEYEFVFNVLFSAKCLRESIVEYSEEKKCSLLHIEDIFKYISKCKRLCISNSPLVHTRLKKYKKFRNKLQLSFCLKLGVEELYNNINEYLDKKNGTLFLEHFIMQYIPQVFSCRANNNIWLVLSHCMHSNLAFSIARHYKYTSEHGKEVLATVFDSLVKGNSLPLIINKGIMASRRSHAVHLFFLRQSEKKKDTVVIYDDEHLHDLENHLSPQLCHYFTLVHIKKITFLHSKQLEIMVHAVLASSAKVIVSSQLVHKNIAGDTAVIQAWHGSGFLKVTTFSDTKWVNRADYMLISSVACTDVYSKAYKIPASKLLPFGTIQSDRYYNEKEIALGKERAFNEFPDLIGKKICFFAPTFRQYTKKEKYTLPPHYMCYWNYEEFDEELEKYNIAIVFKHHPKIKSYQSNRSKLHSDLATSPRRYIRETYLDDIYDWICACDYFMTDYSSAMLYAMLVQKKLLFYAPDFDEYMNEGNGMYIDFRKESPGPIVTSSSVTSFINALLDVDSDKYNDAYSSFKYKQMNLCHGKACEQLKEFIENIYFK